MSCEQSSGMENFRRLESFVAKNLQNILKREMDNKNSIYLYNVGDMWVALEYSAYQLELMTNELDGNMVFRFYDRPMPVVLRVISDVNVRSLCKNNKNQEFIQIPAPTLNKESFNDWYRELVIDL